MCALAQRYRRSLYQKKLSRNLQQFHHFSQRGKFRDHPQRAFLVYKLISIILGIIYRLSPTYSFMRETEGTFRSNNSLMMPYSSKSPPKISCQGSPCLLSSSMKGSGSNSSTLYTPAFFQSPCMKRRAPMQAGTPVV